MQRLDVDTVPLRGLHLVEASAGTGKTHAITGLYQRLVLEAGIPVPNILVVTYTKAATEELRSRIRERLAATRAALAAGGDDPPEEERRLRLRRATDALRGFDEAAIYTIHGFCQRVLGDAAFESGAAFEAELVPDERALLQEVVDDFWRREFYTASPLLVGHLLAQGWTPEKLCDLVRPYLGKPYLEVRAAAATPRLEPLETEYRAAYGELRAIWREQGEEALLRLRAAVAGKALNAASYKLAKVEAWARQLAALLEPEEPLLRGGEALEKLSATALAGKTNKGKAPPEHPLFDACGRLHAAHRTLAEGYGVVLKALRPKLLAFCNEELARRKRREQRLSYDDLLLDLDRALAGPGGARLAEAVAGRYRAALIDEFQDTDPVQFGIFQRLYQGREGPVFLVGDPKQAIYSFRGADIFAYLRARRGADQAHTLDTNWRSTPDLIAAVNSLFERHPLPFLFEEIPFQPAEAAAKTRESLRIAGEEELAPLRIWPLPLAEARKALSKNEAAAQAVAATAAAIARLLNLSAQGRATLGGRSLEGGDIAVLVRKHRHGRQMREALLALGVPSVQQAQDDVFDTLEAQELERVLLALAEPGREALVRAALAGSLMGADGARLYALSQNESAWEAVLEDFHRYHRLWRERGFMPMFRAWLAEQGVASRLLAHRDGERRLTNLLHLAELLQKQASAARLGLEGLVKWFADRRASRGGADEEALLRLESDEQLVKIVTIHKSKGLQYPIVFCPFLWDAVGKEDEDAPFTFHERDEARSAVLELGSERAAACRPLAREEALAEDLRLLYVALTRAQYQCSVVWGKISQAQYSGLAWLLHAPGGRPADPLQALEERYTALDANGLGNDLEKLVAAGQGRIVLQEPPATGEPYRPQPPAEPELRALPAWRELTMPWRIGSFTALVAGSGSELPDHDAGPAPAEEEPGREREPSVFTFPRGAKAGTCLHALFERLDFASADAASVAALAERVLTAHGFDADQWGGAVTRLVAATLDAPLGEDGLRLRGIGLSRRLTELGFHYPVRGLAAPGLAALLARHLPEPYATAAQRLAFRPLDGFLKGFIDLVFQGPDGRFYLADYKSNWLGESAEDYAPGRLPPVMARDDYYLQYLLYTVAVHRYLGERLRGYDYRRHFGGVYYLFLRGLDPARPGHGVFFDRPAPELVTELDRWLGGA
ncbi:MAG TPA: exodeoxyribonuclease V subunit beta [Nevskiales bacterium]|nr:exodeoxyribonuclease V subunit beta [Nevskiales bacterium]